MSRGCCLAAMEVLDTAALLSWPLEMLIQGICANSQLNEIQRLSPSRHLMLEAQGPRFETPNPEAIAVTTEANQETKNFNNLSSIDLDVLTLTLSTNYTLITDNYRMQNVCSHRGHPWRGVIQKKVHQVRSHALECVGCGSVHRLRKRKRTNQRMTVRLFSMKRTTTTSFETLIYHPKGLIMQGQWP